MNVVICNLYFVQFWIQQLGSGVIQSPSSRLRGQVDTVLMPLEEMQQLN